MGACMTKMYPMKFSYGEFGDMYECVFTCVWQQNSKRSEQPCKKTYFVTGIICIGTLNMYNRRWLPTDMDAFFNFIFLVLFF